MLNILIDAYAIAPNWGSEQGMGWNWITALAHYCECFVVTECEYKIYIDSWMANKENALLAKNIHFFWNPIDNNDMESKSIRKMCWNQGDWRFYKYYKKWQKKTADIARSICKKEKIDILHQLNMIGFREPGYLWQVSKETGIPFVWGPTDSKDEFPLQYTEGAGLKTKIFLWLKGKLLCI